MLLSTLLDGHAANAHNDVITLRRRGERSRTLRLPSLACRNLPQCIGFAISVRCRGLDGPQPHIGYFAGSRGGTHFHGEVDDLRSYGRWRSNATKSELPIHFAGTNRRKTKVAHRGGGGGLHIDKLSRCVVLCCVTAHTPTTAYEVGSPTNIGERKCGYFGSRRA